MRPSPIHLLVLLFAVMGSSACFKSKNVVSKVPPANGKLVTLNGVPYALPRTVVHVQVPFKRKDASPGRFEPFAPCFFPSDIAADRVRKKAKSFAIQPATFTSRGEPDPDEHYIAKIKGGYFENKTMFLEFNGDGVITKGDASSENVAVDIAINAAKTAVSLIAKGITPTGAAALGESARTADDRANMTRSQADLCRAQVLADIARIAASSAKDAADASKNTSAVTEAGHAAEEIQKIDQIIAAGATEFDFAVEMFETGSPDFTKKLDKFNSGAPRLLNDVICEAQTVKDHVEAAARFAHSTAPDEADAATNIASEIDQKIIFIGRDPHKPCPHPNDQDGQNDRAVMAFQNNYAKAKQVYDRILELRRGLEELATGSTAPQGISADGLKIMLDETNTTINQYQKSNFLGTADEDNWTGEFEFTPGKAATSTSYNISQASPALFLFSTKQGLCETAETKKEGVRVKASFKADKCDSNDAGAYPDGFKAVWVRVDRKLSDDGFLGHMANANARDERDGERGFYYRIPAQALVQLQTGRLDKKQLDYLETESIKGQLWRRNGHDQEAPPPNPSLPDGSEFARQTIKVAQLGVTASVPASAAGRKTQYTIDFDESTGALKNFKLASNALLEKSLVDDSGAAAQALIDAKKARSKAKSDANDPLAQKKRELDILTTENGIDEQKKKKAANGPQP